MALNRGGKSELGTVLMWVAIIGVVAYVANFGGFQNTVNNLFSGSDNGAGSGNQGGGSANLASCPTDGTTTYTLNVQDALTSSATDVVAEYYIFGGNKLIKSGAVSGTTTVDVACGSDYDLLLVNTTAATGAYAESVKLQARIAEDTVNEKLTRFGDAKILGIENPADPARNSSITLGAGGMKNFDIKIVANATEKGYNKPIILCQVNITSIQSLSISSFSDGTTVKTVAANPKRVAATSGYQYYGWEYPKMLDPSKGVLTASGLITAQSSTTPSTADAMTCILVDQATWKTSNYKTASSIDEAFKEGAENTETLGDVGAGDSAAATLKFNNPSGY